MRIPPFQGFIYSRVFDPGLWLAERAFALGYHILPFQGKQTRIAIAAMSSVREASAAGGRCAALALNHG